LIVIGHYLVPFLLSLVQIYMHLHLLKGIFTDYVIRRAFYLIQVVMNISVIHAISLYRFMFLTP